MKMVRPHDLLDQVGGFGGFSIMKTESYGEHIKNIEEWHPGKICQSCGQSSWPLQLLDRTCRAGDPEI